MGGACSSNSSVAVADQSTGGKAGAKYVSPTKAPKSGAGGDTAGGDTAAANGHTGSGGGGKNGDGVTRTYSGGANGTGGGHNKTVNLTELDVDAARTHSTGGGSHNEKGGNTAGAGGTAGTGGVTGGTSARFPPRDIAATSSFTLPVTTSNSPAQGTGSGAQTAAGTVAQSSPRRLPVIVGASPMSAAATLAGGGGGGDSKRRTSLDPLTAANAGGPNRPALAPINHPNPNLNNTTPPALTASASTIVASAKPRDLPPLGPNKPLVAGSAASSEQKRPDSSPAGSGAPGLDRMATRDRVRTRGERLDEKDPSAVGVGATEHGGLTIITNNAPVVWNDDMYRICCERVLKPYRDRQLKKRRSLQRGSHLSLNKDNFGKSGPGGSRSVGNSARSSARTSPHLPPRGIMSADNSTVTSPKSPDSTSDGEPQTPLVAHTYMYHKPSPPHATAAGGAAASTTATRGEHLSAAAAAAGAGVPGGAGTTPELLTPHFSHAAHQPHVMMPSTAPASVDEQIDPRVAAAHASNSRLITPRSRGGAGASAIHTADAAAAAVAAMAAAAAAAASSPPSNPTSGEAKQKKAHTARGVEGGVMFPISQPRSARHGSARGVKRSSAERELRASMRKEKLDNRQQKSEEEGARREFTNIMYNMYVSAIIPVVAMQHYNGHAGPTANPSTGPVSMTGGRPHALLHGGGSMTSTTGAGSAAAGLMVVGMNPLSSSAASSARTSTGAVGGAAMSSSPPSSAGPNSPNSPNTAGSNSSVVSTHGHGSSQSGPSHMYHGVTVTSGGHGGAAQPVPIASSAASGGAGGAGGSISIALPFG